MKLLIVAGNLASEGMGRFAHGLINALASKYPDIEITVLAPKRSNDLQIDQRCTLIEVPDLYRARSYLHVFGYMQILVRESAHVDLVHFATDFPNYLLGSLRVGIPYIITAHGTYSMIGLMRGIRKYFIRRAFRGATAIHAVSNFTAKKVESVLLGLKMVRVINHAIDISEDRKMDRGNTEPLARFILSAGGVKPRKGIHVALEAFATVASEFPDVRYFITGESAPGEYLSNLQASIKRHKLDGRVSFLGHVSESKLQELYRDCEIYVQPSITEPSVFEGYGIVFLEAGTYHKPVLATRGSGIEDAVIDGETGILVDQNDIPATTQALRRMLQDRAFAQRLGEGNYRNSYNQRWEVVVEQFRSLYESVKRV